MRTTTINNTTTIRELYSLKNNKYIQIGGRGLYHLGDDIYDFGVPEFLIEQRLRVRIKNHGTKTNGICSYSVTAACQPKPGFRLKESPYSLDDINNLPQNLTYDNNL